MPLSLLNHSAVALFVQRTRIPTSPRCIGFCAIWVYISSSSSSRGGGGRGGAGFKIFETETGPEGGGIIRQTDRDKKQRSVNWTLKANQAHFFSSRFYF